MLQLVRLLLLRVRMTRHLLPCPTSPHPTVPSHILLCGGTPHSGLPFLPYFHSGIALWHQNERDSYNAPTPFFVKTQTPRSPPVAWYVTVSHFPFTHRFRLIPRHPSSMCFPSHCWFRSLPSHLPTQVTRPYPPRPRPRHHLLSPTRPTFADCTRFPSEWSQ